MTMPSERTQASDTARWLAGRIFKCEGGTDHSVTNIHVIVRCECGAAFMSTDAGLALGMAEAHKARAGSGPIREGRDGNHA